VSPILGIWASQNYSRVTGSYESIATTTVGSGGAANAEFTSIPSTYTHLQIRYIAQTSGYPKITFNNDTSTNYYSHWLYGNGTSASAAAFAGSSYNSIVWADTMSTTSNNFNVGIIDILDYTSTNKNKTIKVLSGQDLNGSGTVYLSSGVWSATPAAITTIKLFPHASNTWSQYSQFALYGIRGA